MKTYIGSKIIRATPMTDLEFEAERNAFQTAERTVNNYKAGENLLRPNLCAGGARNEERREPVNGYKVMYPDGYFSWSPKETFEAAYREISNSEKSLI